ncbi:hypothetical protein CYLTODRAFT_418838 [Cylindrobasidium torrendii FP15055 ss-10]|uniref:Uncharacterized protein n=1 Tax=Cylindrobasidium torrendii FP15055 ss-10 TaxID=1314674 RepID=A0A0D7BLL8_9AGAR|nr:hypothetical protein CYLTODRAFT_418838 [Cylindrobasidium torrendii FP15055 ss-10]
MAAPFSRLQLAAALIEYDNDPDNPNAPYRSAQESALFTHFRRNPRPPPLATRKSSNYVGVALPSEAGSVAGRDSIMDGRRSRGSTLALRNPFGGADEEYFEEESEDPPEMEVDLTSWGVDHFIAKDPKGKGKARSQTGEAPLSSVSAHFPVHASVPEGALPRRRPTRSMSVGDYGHLVAEANDDRRKSVANPLDPELMASGPSAFKRHRAASFTLDASTGPPAVESVPFPSQSIRAPSPYLDYDSRPRSTSIDSRMALGEGRPRSTSIGTMNMLENTDPMFSLEPPKNASRFDPKAAAHARTLSQASLGSRMLLENDGASVMSRARTPSRPLSTFDLLRPKVLVMPSPLQGAKPPPAPEPVREGFIMSTDGTPMPIGSRDQRRQSQVPIASNSFIPNPVSQLSKSQLMFRNTLPGGGTANGQQPDMDHELPRATEDGQQVAFDDGTTDDVVSPFPSDQVHTPGRAPGKLFGRSLIDDLEARKANMKAKQRVFRGDDRPSMMARGHSGTLVNPSELGRPGLGRQSSYLSSAPGANEPLLNFDDDEKVQSRLAATRGKGTPNARSVFGVDTLWEREMAKLKEMEAQEKAEEEERERNTALEQIAQDRKKRGVSEIGTSPNANLTSAEEDVVRPISAAPPVLPMPTPKIHGPPPVLDDDEDSESDEEPAPKPKARKKDDGAGWHSDSTEGGPRKTTGVGLRNPKQALASNKPYRKDDDSSEDDVPLAKEIMRARARQTAALDSDSEEENQPLSTLMRKSSHPSAAFHGQPTASSSLGLPDFNFDRPSAGNADDDEDDKPLGLRASHVAPSFVGSAEEDDDRPLGMHPDQLRRSQMVMAQQQHQQMMMQAQMTGSMFFNPMSSGFFSPQPMMPGPMPQMPMMPPIQVPSPPPVQDPAKFNRVDNWRHEVAIKGE